VLSEIEIKSPPIIRKPAPKRQYNDAKGVSEYDEKPEVESFEY
jgi:hypothetical protein